MQENLSKQDLKLITNILITAEDRRFLYHYGIDLIGIARAITIYFKKRQVQGASTITQQLVRVLTNDFRISFKRKFKEICIACVIDKKIKKDDQVIVYLQIAYFGWRMNGINQALHRLNLKSPISILAAAGLIARLKYPEARIPSPEYYKKLNKRVAYIMSIAN